MAIDGVLYVAGEVGIHVGGRVLRHERQYFRDFAAGPKRGANHCTGCRSCSTTTAQPCSTTFFSTAAKFFATSASLMCSISSIIRFLAATRAEVNHLSFLNWPRSLPGRDIGSPARIGW